MRFATVRLRGKVQWGSVDDADFEPWTSAALPTLKSAISAGALHQGDGATGDRVPLSKIEWLPPIPDPNKILCVGLNYESHRKETSRSVNEHPTFFIRFADSQIGHAAALLVPSVSDKLDYEGELAIVIGGTGRSVPIEAAMSLVAGFSCYNDGSIRDWQRHTTQFTPGKNFPHTGAFGPWLVTPDAFGDLTGKRIVTRLNGETMQNAALTDMIFNIPRLIAYASTFTPLSPGDVIVTGTPGGVGAMREPPVFMKAGDQVEVEIDGIGTLSNPVEQEK